MIRLDLSKVRAALAVVMGLMLLASVSARASASATLPPVVGDTDSVAPANAPQAKPILDHYWCYRTTSTPVNEVVGLQDQFNTGLVNATVGAPDRFCNPVKKKHGEKVFKIVDPNAHLVMYNLGLPGDFLLKVEVRNQFGTQQLRVFAPATKLAVPTQLAGTPPPASLDHFKCYKVRGAAVNVTVGLKDMFRSEPALVVGKPQLLCNPTRKVHGANTFEVLHPEAHLVCYHVTKIALNRTVQTINQFRAEQLTIRNPDMLCAPSKKKILD